MPDFKRTDRVAETMQRELARIIQQGHQEPRIPGLVTISTVRVSRDLSHAKVYFTVFNADPHQTEEMLNGAAHHFRFELARAMVLRVTPELHFVYDKSIDYGNRLSRLIDEVNVARDDEGKTD